MKININSVMIFKNGKFFYKIKLLILRILGYEKPLRVVIKIFEFKVYNFQTSL